MLQLQEKGASLQKLLERFIRKVSFPLKEGKELELALKAKLTKKEFKLFKALNQALTKEQICKELKLSTKEYETIYTKMQKKLNLERVKQALYKKSNEK